MEGFLSAISSLRLSKNIRRANVPKFTLRNVGCFAEEDVMLQGGLYKWKPVVHLEERH